MKRERDFSTIIRSWLRETPPGPPDRDAVYARMLDRLPDTHQRRHWRPSKWFPFGAGATRSADSQGPHQLGRSRSMLNATRIAAVTAILAVGGSFLYLGGNLGPSSVPGAAPGAEITEVAVGAARVTGTVGAIEDSFGEVEYLPDRSVQREYTTTYLNQMSDARLSGRGTGTNYLEAIQTDAGVFLSHSSSGELENDGGTWTLSCTGAGLETPEGIDGSIPCWYVGEGGYEGLTALVVLGDFDGTIWQAEGWVFPGDPPPME